MAWRQVIETRTVVGGAFCVSQFHCFTVRFFQRGGGGLCNRPRLILVRAEDLDGAEKLGRRGGAVSYRKHGHVSIVR